MQETSSPRHFIIADALTCKAIDDSPLIQPWGYELCCKLLLALMEHLDAGEVD